MRHSWSAHQTGGNVSKADSLVHAKGAFQVAATNSTGNDDEDRGDIEDYHGALVKATRAAIGCKGICYLEDISSKTQKWNESRFAPKTFLHL